jgi:TrmH family RNA methyltransferase
MLSKNEVKDIQSLRQKKFRDEARLFVAEGPKIVSELVLLIPQQIKMIYALKSWIDHHQGLLEGKTVVEISSIELEKISGLTTPNEVVAVLHQATPAEPVGYSFALFLDAIQDPGNFGTIIRTADWFGIKHIVCGAGCADVYNSKVVQATMASIGRVNVYYDESGDWLAKQTQPKYAAALNGVSLYELPRLSEGILIIGRASARKLCCRQRKGLPYQELATLNH